MRKALQQLKIQNFCDDEIEGPGKATPDSNSSTTAEDLRSHVEESTAKIVKNTCMAIGSNGLTVKRVLPPKPVARKSKRSKKNTSVLRVNDQVDLFISRSKVGSAVFTFCRQ